MDVLRSYFHLHSVRTAALVYFLAAGLLSLIPLFNYLGYEFCAVLTIPAAFVSAFLTLDLLRTHLSRPLTRRTWLFVIGDYLVVNWLLLLIPLFVISINALAVKNCSFGQGMIYFLLLPVCTVFFSVSLSLACGAFFHHAKTIVGAVILIILLDIVYITYTHPQLFAYNLILGYFPGITYDETLIGFSPLLLYREFTIVWSLLLIILFFLTVGLNKRKKSISRFIRSIHSRKGSVLLASLAALCCGILLYGYYEKADLGFEYTQADIQSSLGGMAFTQHFIIYYPLHTTLRADVQLLKAEAEFDYSIVTDRLNEKLQPGQKIYVYLYPDAETKRRFIGTGTTNISKPWSREIDLTRDSFEETFRHELVHVLAGNFGLPIIHASLRMGLNEGLAMAIDWRGTLFSPHEYAAALLREHLLGNPEDLFDFTGFATKQSAYAYTVAGSFSKYLIDRFGIDRFKKVFTSAAFLAVYGESLPSLIDDWKSFLATVNDSALPSETVKTIFLQPSIFHKTCARVTAEQNAAAVRAIHIGDFGDAEKAFTASFQDAETPFAFEGLLQSLIGQKKYHQALVMYDNLDEHSSLRYHPAVLLLVADALWLEGQTLEAMKLYTRIEEMNYNAGYDEAAALRILMVPDPDLVKLANLFYAHLADSSRILLIREVRAEKPSSPPVEFEWAKDLYRSRKFLKAGDVWTTLPPNLSDNFLKWRCLMDAGEAFYRATDFERAKICFWESKNTAPSNMAAQNADEWIERCSFVENME
jgi:tetratricopeptide (TPR) repeat protein